MLPSSTPAQPVLSTPTAIPPTPIVLPTATTNPNSINFVVGTTAVVERGNVLAGQTVSYTMDANANQAMILSVTSPNGDVSLGVLEQDGSILINPSHKWSHVQWLLPGTEQYTIEVVGGATSENYILTVKVAVLLYFASGATSMTVSGYTPLGYVFSYSLFCNSGQTMAVSLNVPSSTAYLDVFGIASGLLLNPGSHKNSWSGTLPQTEAYVIEVIPAGGGVVGYSLTVSVH
jgi:hypothetical protein